MVVIHTTTGVMDYHTLPACEYGAVWDGGDPNSCTGLPCTRVTQCAPEEVPINDGVDCTCAPGYYRPSATSGCTACPAGSYCPGGESKSLCTEAVVGSSSTAGAVSDKQCTCDPGEYVFRSDAVGECSTCPAGFWCPKLSATDPSFQGYFACPGGRTAPAGAVTLSDCECKDGWRAGEDGVCIHCASNDVVCTEVSGSQARTENKVQFSVVIAAAEAQQFRDYVAAISIPLGQVVGRRRVLQTGTVAASGTCPQSFLLNSAPDIYPGAPPSSIKLFCEAWVTASAGVTAVDAVARLSTHLTELSESGLATGITVFHVNNYGQKSFNVPVAVLLSNCPQGEMDAGEGTCECGWGYTKEGAKCTPCGKNTYKDSISNSDECSKCPDGSSAEEGAKVCTCTKKGFEMETVDGELVCRNAESGVIYRSETLILGLSPLYFSLIIVGVLILLFIAYELGSPRRKRASGERKRKAKNEDAVPEETMPMMPPPQTRPQPVVQPNPQPMLPPQYAYPMPPAPFASNYPAPGYPFPYPPMQPPQFPAYPATGYGVYPTQVSTPSQQDGNQ